MAGCFQTSEWYVDGQPARYLAGKGGGFGVPVGIGHVAGHALWDPRGAHWLRLVLRRLTRINSAWGM
ncbi:hypothetical protein OIU84_011166 [Salix udensis]|uniref:Uncharacterized protein n=1 Tax=Salix udensis TaxID=889485 RepID=A0AAD6JPG7_9ROSI|nr:hypothetical protein OIU84_011166 [Salix udensis]